MEYRHVKPINCATKTPDRGDQMVDLLYHSCYLPSFLFYQSYINHHAYRMSDSLQMEQEVYGDLVQEDFIDTYHNLTYKVVLQWGSFTIR